MTFDQYWKKESKDVFISPEALARDVWNAAIDSAHDEILNSYCFDYIDMKEYQSAFNNIRVKS